MGAGRTEGTMTFAMMRRVAGIACWAFVALVALSWADQVAYAAGLNDDDSASRSNRSSRSSSSDDDDDFEDDDDDSDRRSSRSRSSRASSSRSDSRDSSRSSSRSSRRSSGSRGGGRSSKYSPPAVVFGQSYERSGVRPRGTLLSVEAFEDLPCTAATTTIGTTTYYRCGGVWYNQVNHEGWVVYSEIYPPAGVGVDSLPSGHQTIRAGDRTLYASADAFYEAAPGGRNRYVVVEPTVGLTLDQLPAKAKEGIPVQSGRHTYYRYLGVFYREDDSTGKTRYVASPNPFMPPPSVAATTATGAGAAPPPAQASVPPPATGTITYR